MTDHDAIRNLIARYCRGIDRRDRPLVRGCFHPDATDDHGTGPRPIEEFLDWCFNLLDGYDCTFHMVGQSLISVDGAVDSGGAGARVETYGIAHHRSAGGPDHRNLVTGFRYLDRLECRIDEWRIAERVAVTDWSRVDRESEWWPVPPQLIQGRSGMDDPSYG